MTLVGCFVTPHPAIIVPEVGGDRLGEVEATVRAMRLVRERVAALAPETVVILSPHAAIWPRQMGVSLASRYEGSLAYFGAPRVAVSAPGDRELGEAILERAGARGVPVAVTASAQEMAELDHGALVPLVYVMGGLPEPCRLVLLAFSQLGIPEHVSFGRAVGEALIESESRSVYVASGDLSHRLTSDAPVGYDPCGVEFDGLVADTFARGDWTALLAIQPGLVAAAGECGYRSLAVLAGLVDAVETAGGGTGNRLFSYEGPFGVGYLVGEVEIMEGLDMDPETVGTAE